MTYEILFEENPDPNDVQVLGGGIIAYAKQQKNLGPICFFIRGKNNQIVGGCNGDILYGCLYVSDLWVNESLRNKAMVRNSSKRQRDLEKSRDACLLP